MVQLKKIDPDNIFFIKLGIGGKWNEDCIELEHNVKVGFIEFTNEELQKGNWESVREHYRRVETSPQWVTIYTNQLYNFYHASENTLWITFYKQKMWWAFSSNKVESDKDDRKYRRVIDKLGYK